MLIHWLDMKIFSELLLYVCQIMAKDHARLPLNLTFVYRFIILFLRSVDYIDNRVYDNELKFRISQPILRVFPSTETLTVPLRHVHSNVQNLFLKKSESKSWSKMTHALPKIIIQVKAWQANFASMVTS